MKLQSFKDQQVVWRRLAARPASYPLFLLLRRANLPPTRDPAKVVVAL